MERNDAIAALYRAMVATLAADRSGRRGVEEAHAALTRRVDANTSAIADLPPSHPPTCRHLPVALALCRRQGFAAIADAVAHAHPHLPWVTYDLYPRADIGERFATSHAFAEIVAPEGGFFTGDDVSAGLFLIAPRTLYRDHRHKASELYFPLNGPSRWRRSLGGWQERKAGEPVWHDPDEVHATAVGALPLLLLYVWTRDVTEPAAVVRSADWAVIEAGL
jgi:quercetin dioxygenase-like cupin family protein